MSSFAREGTASHGGGSLQRDPPAQPALRGAAGGAPTETPRPAARPLPARPGPLQGLHSPPPKKRPCGPEPRSPPPRLPERWPGRPGRQSRRGESAVPGSGSPSARRSVHAAGAGGRPEPRTLSSARSARPAGGHLLLGPPTSRLPPGEMKVVTASPLGPPSPARLARRRRGAGRAAALPLASVPSRSPPPLLFTILSSPSLRWVGAGSLEREETFATFLHSFSSTPPHRQP